MKSRRQSCFAALAVSLLAACPPDDSVGKIDLAAAADLATTGDLAGPGECVVPADCAPLDTPASVRFCPRSSWSCIAGRCTWECTGGKTCAPRPGGCLACDGRPPDCPADRCRGLLRLRRPEIDEALCARGYLMEVEACFGDFVQLRDGTLCTIETLPTGLERELLACGHCQTTLVY